jgi:hypothetical protein
MSRRFKVPVSEQYGRDREQYYPIKGDSKEIDYFDPDKEE